MITATYKTYNLLFGHSSFFHLEVGVKPSFGFFRMSSIDVADLLTSGGAPGDLILSDGTHTITLKNIYLVKSVKHQLPTDEGTNPRICDVVLADERILWYFKNGTQDYNTYMASREGIEEFTLTNKNDDEPWTFPELVAELKTLTNASEMILDTTDFNDYPVRNPRHVIGCNIPVWKIVQQVLEQLNAFLTINLNDSENVTYKFYSLGLAEVAADIVQLTTYAPYLKEKRTIEMNPKVQFGASIKMVAAAVDTLNAELRSRLYGEATTTDGSGEELKPSIYAVLGDEVNSIELDTIGDEITAEHKDSFNNVWRNEIYTGLIPFVLNRAVHSARWIISSQGAFTHIKAFRPKPESVKIKNDLFHYGRFHAGVGGMGQQYARIVQSLQEEDLNAVPVLAKRNYYEVELLANPFPRYEEGDNKTYEVGTKWKYDDGNGDNIYEVIDSFTQLPNILPTNPSYWKLSTWTQVWIFGYDYDSDTDKERHLESGNWFVPGQIVVIFRYEDARWPAEDPDYREWWIHETGIRTKDNDNFSLGFIPLEKRMAAFYT